MNKTKLIQILLEIHEKAPKHLEDLAYRYKVDRYLKKDFQEGYKFAILEIQKLIEKINEIYFNAPKVDKDFLNSMRVRE